MGTNIDSLGDRMKCYENVSRAHLMRRNPIIIRIDGKAFHSFTRHFEKPFDSVLVKTMQDTMKYLCEHIEGCVLGYTQSDEISLVLCDYKRLTSQAWFDNNIQKITSVSASMATLAFNKFFIENIECVDNPELVLTYKKRINTALFDSRVFSIPKEEVNNCILWRQQDAGKNSIQMVARANFSHRELEGLNCNQLQEKLFTEKGINWNDTPTHLKRGSCCIKTSVYVPIPDSDTMTQRSKWIIDNEIPIFSKDTNYINSLIVFDGEES